MGDAPFARTKTSGEIQDGKVTNPKLAAIRRETVLRNLGKVIQEREKPLGKVNFSLISTLKTSWRKEGWARKSRAEQASALALMIAVVRADIDDDADQEATLDYISRTIDTW